MKGAPGLIVAALLGLLGFAGNWIYLKNKDTQFESVQLLGISTEVKMGNRFRQSDFLMVPVPKKNAVGIVPFVYHFPAKDMLTGAVATRNYEQGDLVFISDVRTPPPVLKLDKAKKEMLLPIQVDAASFVPDHIDPGDKILFLLPKMHQPTSAAARGAEREPSEDPAVPIVTNTKAETSEAIGPFTVAAVGARLSSFTVAKANQSQAGSGNVISIIATNQGTEAEPKLDEKSARLNAIMQTNQGVKPRVVLFQKN